MNNIGTDRILQMLFAYGGSWFSHDTAYMKRENGEMGSIHAQLCLAMTVLKGKMLS